MSVEILTNIIRKFTGGGALGELRPAFDPPEPGESFGIMERFIRDCIPDDAGIKERLRKAVSERKPFRNFKYVIDGSEYRQKWFDFRRGQLERLVADYLNSLDIDASAK